MARTPDRIAPPRVIADAASALYAQIEVSAAIPEDQRHLWVNATTKAFAQLIDGVRFDRADDGTFTFPSRSRAGLAHRVNGRCDCEAAADGDPCWHRAAKRLVLMIAERGGDPGPAPAAPPPPPPPAPAPAPTGRRLVLNPHTGDLLLYYEGALVGTVASEAEADLAVDAFLELQRAERAEAQAAPPSRAPRAPRRTPAPRFAPGRDAQEEVDELYQPKR